MKQNSFSGEDNACFEQFCESKKGIQLFRSILLHKTISFFIERGFMFIDPPILHEYIQGRSEILVVPTKTKKYDLNASNALYMGAYATIFGNVFAISPTIRMENKSDNHLLEFRLLECEVLIDFQQCVELTKEYIKFILMTMIEQFKGNIYEERLRLLFDTLVFSTIPYKEIISLLKKNGISVEYGDDLSRCDLIVSKLLPNPTFIVDYPCPPATWTALPKNDSTWTFNFILPDGFGELAEGCQRNNDWMVFKNKFEYLGLSSLSWYTEAIKRNPCTRSGFGIGIERLIAWLVGVHTIRETVLFHREGE